MIKGGLNMFCPHCHNKIPDGSNICPLCYANLAGVRQQAEPQGERPEPAPRPARKSAKPAYTKGSRGGKKKNADKTPMIVAFGLILILVIIIAMIIRSMFSANVKPVTEETPVPPQAQNQNVPDGNFIVFGATPTPMAAPTPTPNLEITPSPSPVQSKPVSYRTLHKGDQGPEVVMLQQALTELGYLSGAADGNFGTGTENAVKKFQKDNGLAEDGIPGAQTLEKLYQNTSVTPMPDVTAGPGDIMDLPG